MIQDLVHKLDIQQGRHSADARKCPHEGKPFKLEQSKQTRTEHGNLQAHVSGAFLVCACGYNEPTSNILG